jgi:dolichyl-phosphate beta-glucosyltransferase
MKISIVIPCKNQTETCFENIEKVGLPYFNSLGVDYEFLVVLDGSDDKNVSLAEVLIGKFDEHVKILPRENKLGKGHNVKHGFLEADGDYIMFMDADFATDLHIMERILPEIENYDGSSPQDAAKARRLRLSRPLRDALSAGSAVSLSECVSTLAIPRPSAVSSFSGKISPKP